ncbi:MAG TPA: tetratricopeptide repeat protein [Armatimonadota bacterium]|nr:tetratricopeptide repeat protein [Armatimonadota bacterium]HQK94137.1 tetratricopeptide repeat protein [Armatimonadota bacterium]
MVIDGDPGLNDALLGAMRYLKSGDHEGALDALRRALILAPENATVHAALGNALIAAGRHAEATEAHRRALEITPECPQAYIGLAMTCFARGEDASGRIILDQAARVTERATAGGIAPTADEILDEYAAAVSLPDPERAAIMARLRGLSRERLYRRAFA